MVVTDKGNETRQRILDVAARAFAERGYAGVSLNDVIRQTGLTKGGFYFHFNSKRDLALAVCDQLRDRQRDDALAAAGRHDRAMDQIEAMVRRLAEAKANDPSLAAVSRICGELVEAEPGLREALDPFTVWFRTSEMLIRQAQVEGDVDAALDPATAAWFAVTAFIGADHVGDLRGEPLAARIDDYLEFVRRALGR